MLFNSFSYFVFLPIVFTLYWIIKSKRYRWQNIILIIASYIFYAAWDYRFLFLLMFSTAISYYTGLRIFHAQTKKSKKVWMLISIIISLGYLGFFKYFNFFIESFTDLLSFVGLQPNIWTLKIILPVGISFYTFHGLSYVLDIYNKKIKPTKNIIDYSLFVCFFPLLVAGPIERATHLLPQLQKPRYFDQLKAFDGLKQMLWGFFKKVVIADNCAPIVNQIFDNYESASGIQLVLGVVLFSFQLYGDFSGYSDIALGTARLFGVELLRNFNYPYFATSFADYWRRNHISMTQWFMDYVYYPMTNNRTKLWQWNLCMIVTFLLSGLWHGAGWTFVLWGLYQGLFIVISMNLQKRRKRFEKKYHLKANMPYTLLRILMTFGIVCFGLVFFRSNTLEQAGLYISRLFSFSVFSLDIGEFVVGKSKLLISIIMIALFIIIEWRGRDNQYALANLRVKKKWIRYLFYYFILFCILIFKGTEQQFIYFQF